MNEARTATGGNYFCDPQRQIQQAFGASETVSESSEK
jgi:hypothetical protein